MSKYTTQLRWIVEQISTGLPQPTNHRYPDAVYKYIGLDKYPIFDEEYRYPLNDKIIDHFYFREIGFETAAQFAWYLRRTMNEIMPKYNLLYEAMDNIVPEELLTDKTNKHNESWDKDETEGIDRTLAKTGTDTTTHDGTIESANTGTIVDSGQTSDILDSDTTTNTTDHNRNVFQDTPMSLLDNSSSPTIDGLDYATNVTYDDGTSNIGTELDQTRTGTSSNTRTLGDTNTKTFDNSDTLEHDTLDNENIDRNKNDKGWRVWTDFGRNSSISELSQEFIDKWVNVDMAIINDLEDLFMGIW